MASFTGKEYDATGLLYFNARYYDPKVGRFLTEDPARQGTSWYSYCSNNPLSAVDPDGKEPYFKNFPIELVMRWESLVLNAKMCAIYAMSKKLDTLKPGNVEYTVTGAALTTAQGHLMVDLTARTSLIRGGFAGGGVATIGQVGSGITAADMMYAAKFAEEHGIPAVVFYGSRQTNFSRNIDKGGRPWNPGPPPLGSDIDIAFWGAGEQQIAGARASNFMEYFPLTDTSHEIMRVSNEGLTKQTVPKNVRWGHGHGGRIGVMEGDGIYDFSNMFVTPGNELEVARKIAEQGGLVVFSQSASVEVLPQMLWGDYRPVFTLD